MPEEGLLAPDTQSHVLESRKAQTLMTSLPCTGPVGHVPGEGGRTHRAGSDIEAAVYRIVHLHYKVIG
jgi:hypothetical protein